MIRAAWASLLDTVLGARCRRGCGQRVFPADVRTHEDMEHAGDNPNSIVVYIARPGARRRERGDTDAG